MKKVIYGAGVVALFLLVFGLASAGAQGQLMLHNASNLVGTEVRDQQGRDLGKITEIMVDSNGQAVFAIISHNTFAGLGPTEIAIPFAALQYDHQRREFMTNVSKERLETELAFNPRSLKDPTTVDTIYRLYGLAPYWEGSPSGSFQPGMAPEEGMAPEGMIPESEMSPEYIPEE